MDVGLQNRAVSRFQHTVNFATAVKAVRASRRYAVVWLSRVLAARRRLTDYIECRPLEKNTLSKVRHAIASKV